MSEPGVCRRSPHTDHLLTQTEALLELKCITVTDATVKIISH
jgi:hypothetical protein